MEDYARIRHAHYNEGKTIRQIAREMHCGRKTVRQALEGARPPGYQLSKARPAPALDIWKEQIDALLAESATMPRKQRYTAHRIFTVIQAAGFGGGESTVRAYVRQKRPNLGHKPQRFLPLAFDRGEAAEMDWGEADVEMQGARITVQYFAIRLCYSRRKFVCAYPTQRQESFFDGHVRAFAFFGGVPRMSIYDNLKVAVQKILTGKTRKEQEAFVLFRSHYLFESRFCTPGEGHEKGGVESDIGFARRNFFSPLIRCESFEDLNTQLLVMCHKEDLRTVSGQPEPIYRMWQQEQPHLRPLPSEPFVCCVTIEVVTTPYSQVTYDTNRYSVPADDAARTLTVQAYPFKIRVLDPVTQRVIASHVRSYGHKEDICDPLHYLSLLERRPGAFQHARPMRQWRANWPAIYDKLLVFLTESLPDGRGVPELIRILGLHRIHPAHQIEQAVRDALAHSCAHFDGVKLCLHRIQNPDRRQTELDLTQQPGLAHLDEMGRQGVNLAQYDQLTQTNRGEMALC